MGNIMLTNRKLPSDFIRRVESLAESYLMHDDPISQSGFGGGAVRWRQERKPIIDPIDSDGDILDVGCANGYLLECLIKWGKKKGVNLIPFGVDISDKLVQLARKRLPQYSANFHAANAWDWIPPKKFKYVYALYDCVPEDYLGEFINRLMIRMVADSGRLIVGAYGSRSKAEAPFDIEGYLMSKGFKVGGRTSGGSPPIASFVWIDK